MIHLLAASILLSAAPPESKADTAQAQLTKLERKAATDHKNLLVIFHASWCGWCHKLDALLENPMFQPTFDKNYEILHVDVQERGPKKDLETPGGAALQAKVGAAKEGLPYYLAMDPQGHVLMDSKNPTNIGYPSTPAEVEYFIKFLGKTAPHISAQDLTSMKNYLTATKS